MQELKTNSNFTEETTTDASAKEPQKLAVKIEELETDTKFSIPEMQNGEEIDFRQASEDFLEKYMKDFVAAYDNFMFQLMTAIINEKLSKFFSSTDKNTEDVGQEIQEEIEKLLALYTENYQRFLAGYYHNLFVVDMVKNGFSSEGIEEKVASNVNICFKKNLTKISLYLLNLIPNR